MQFQPFLRSQKSQILPPFGVQYVQYRTTALLFGCAVLCRS
jgi:hypothetical protein